MIKTRFCAISVILLLSLAVSTSAQIKDPRSLLVDIPEPPGARSELPSPVPMVYQFMGAMMDGEFDICLSHFDVETFLTILFSRQIDRMSPEEYRELYSFQVQTQRNEFRFLSNVMNRVAKGAKISYSDPRYHKKIQSKIVIRLDTNRGKFEFVVYCRFKNNNWAVYDYVLNDQRLSKIFLNALRGVGVDSYAGSLRPFYGRQKGFRPIRSKEFDFSIKVPGNYKVRQNVSNALMASVAAFNKQFLLHIQTATYDEPQNLSDVGKAIKDSLMPFDPRLYDQWKSELAGVEIGNVLFHFLKNDKRLYTHMVIIPLGHRLIVLNFYHSSLQLLKHMTNLRERMLETMALPKLESVGGVLPGEIPDELTLTADEDELGLDNDFGDSGDVSFSPSSEPEPDSDDSDFYNSEIPPPSDDEADMLTPDSYVDDDSGSSDFPDSESYEEDPGFVVDDSEVDYPDFPSDEEIPPPPPPPGSYGDGTGSGDDADYFPGDGSEVAF
ncbi:MAG: hypothetical protein ACQETH_12370 [Candidatus Rifleibacteriota bacterium]